MIFENLDSWTIAIIVAAVIVHLVIVVIIIISLMGIERAVYDTGKHIDELSKELMEMNENKKQELDYKRDADYQKYLQFRKQNEKKNPPLVDGLDDDD